MKNIEFILEAYKKSTKETLFRDILLFAKMCYPGESEKYLRKRHAYVLKTMIKFYGNASNKIMMHDEDCDKKDLSIAIGACIGEFISDVGGWGTFSELLLTGKQLDFNEEIISQKSKGIVVGVVLHTAIRNKCCIAEASELYKSSFTEDHEFIGNLRNSKRDQFLRIDPKTFVSTTWQEFKDVAHIWAAFNAYITVGIDLSISPVVEFDSFIPKNPTHEQRNGYAGFCDTANFYRELGCAFKPKRAAKTILNPSTCKPLIWFPLG